MTAEELCHCIKCNKRVNYLFVNCEHVVCMYMVRKTDGLYGSI